MRHVLRRSARVLTLILFGLSLTSCGTFTNSDIKMGPRIGFRPDDPSFATTTMGPRIGPLPDDGRITATTADPCQALTEYIKYAVNLKEAYRTRATQNRTWIYVAALTGLGVAAASGALAAATAVAAGTLGLLAISGGFTASVFATIDNSELANVYTVVANDIGMALTHAEARVARCSSREECSGQLSYLMGTVTTARNTLETARTSSAAGALARATAQKKLLDEEIAKVQKQAEAQAQAKEAADKRAAADKAKSEADAAQTVATKANEAANKQGASIEAKDAAMAASGVAAAKARDFKDKEREAKEAEAKKAEIDAAARAAATAPVAPSCLRSPDRIPGRIFGFAMDDRAKGSANAPVQVKDDTALPLDIFVDNVDLRNVGNDRLFVEVGGVNAPVVNKTNPDLNQPYLWIVRFVPPPKKPKDATWYPVSLLYETETLASAPSVTITYK